MTYSTLRWLHDLHGWTRWVCSLETPVTWYGNVCLAAWDTISKAPSLKPYFLSSLLTENCKFYLNTSSTPKPKSLPLSGDTATYSFNFIPSVKAICWMLSYKLDYRILMFSTSENLIHVFLMHLMMLALLCQSFLMLNLILQKLSRAIRTHPTSKPALHCFIYDFRLRTSTWRLIQFNCRLQPERGYFPLFHLPSHLLPPAFWPAKIPP